MKYSQQQIQMMARICLEWRAKTSHIIHYFDVVDRLMKRSGLPRQQVIDNIKRLAQ